MNRVECGIAMCQDRFPDASRILHALQEALEDEIRGTFVELRHCEAVARISSGGTQFKIFFPFNPKLPLRDIV